MEVIWVLLCMIASTLCNVMGDQVWSAVTVSDFPTDPNIGSTAAGFKLGCAQIASVAVTRKMFCFDSSTSTCNFYRVPPAAGMYRCNNSCQQGTLSCYQRVPPPDMFTPSEAASGTINATNVYDIPMENIWEFPMLVNYIIQFDIKSFDITNCGCSCASFEIQDLDTNAVIDSHTYCDASIPTPITIHSNRVKIVFKTDGSMVLPGFELDVTTIECWSCTDNPITTMTDLSAEIQAHTVALTSMTCTWKVNVPSGNVLKIDFFEFDLTSCCACANFSINDAAFTQKPLNGGPHCGTTLPANIPVTISNDVNITLFTDGTALLPGFRIQYQVTPEPPLYLCSGDQVLTTEPGTIKPVASGNYSDYMACTWRLTAPAGSQIQLYFLWFQLEYGYDQVESTDLTTNTVLGGWKISYF